MADSRRKYSNHPASNPALIVLLLMETEEHANNYCSALREVLAAGKPRQLSPRLTAMSWKQS